MQAPLSHRQCCSVCCRTLFIDAAVNRTVHWTARLRTCYAYRIDDINVTKLAFLPRDAMHSADNAVARCPSVCPSICPSHVGIVSTRLNISSNFFTVREPCHSIFRTKRYGNIPTGTPTGASNARGVWKSRFPANVSLYLRNDTR